MSNGFNVNELYAEESTTEVEEKEVLEVQEDKKWEDSGLKVETTDETKVLEEASHIVAVEDSFKERFFSKVNDPFLNSLKDIYTPEDSEDPEVEEVVPRIESPLYKIEVDNNLYQSIIRDKYESTGGKIASFALEELNLHNRLIDVRDAERAFGNFVLVSAPLGNLVVAKELDTGSDVIEQFKNEAIDCIKDGRRITINLVEQYIFQDEHGRELLRERFRATLSEIREFIKYTRMRGIITDDAHLVIYE